nr:MAG TPA: hypothetical protein [Caudoviricetes sp.]
MKFYEAGRNTCLSHFQSYKLKKSHLKLDCFLNCV